jgi:DNA polymerase III subunit epsilon
MILFFDTETTGIPDPKLPAEDPSQPRVVQIAAIMDYPDGTEAQRLDVILYCDDVPEEASNVHGITTEISRKIGLNEGTGIDLFIDMLEVSELVVAHNAPFDIGILTGSARRITCNPTFDPFAGKPVFDTMRAGKIILKLPDRQGGLRNPSLTVLHKGLFGCDFEGAHRAITDVLATRKCFYELRPRIEALTTRVAA